MEGHIRMQMPCSVLLWSRPRAVGLVLPRVSSCTPSLTRQNYVSSWGRERAQIQKADMAKKYAVTGANDAKE